MFPDDGGKVDRLEFMSSKGGLMGEWHWAIQSAVGLNSDNSSRAQFRGTDRCETFEVYPHTADMLSGREVSVETIAKADGALDEGIAFASGGELWSDHIEHYELQMQNAVSQIQTSTMYPEEAFVAIPWGSSTSRICSIWREPCWMRRCLA